MEKISLYDFLSILLPGALLTFALELFVNTTIVNLDLSVFEDNDFLNLTVFLSASIFLGSLINIGSRWGLKYHKKIGLYTSIPEIYRNSSDLDEIKPFIDEKINQINSYDDLDKATDSFWNLAYYELEANEKISNPKTYQSFYFFFRNFFTLGLAISFLLIITTIVNGFLLRNFMLLFLNLLAMALSILAGSWYRNKMVEKLFWTYYSLNKKH